MPLFALGLEIFLMSSPVSSIDCVLLVSIEANKTRQNTIQRCNQSTAKYIDGLRWISFASTMAQVINMFATRSKLAIVAPHARYS